MPYYDDISAQTLLIIGSIVAVIFIIMLLRICFNISVLRKSRKEQDARIQQLLLSNMIDRLNIPRKYYFRKTSDQGKEQHIWACERCPKPGECEDMFLGEDIKPDTFYPNYNELEKLKG
jgi:hypothetical protein